MAISLPLGASNTGTNDWVDVYNNDAQLVNEFDDRDSNYQTILAGTGTYGASTSGTRYFVHGTTLSANANLGSGLILFYFSSSDNSISSKTQKLRIRAQQGTVATGPGTTLTVGMYPVTAVSAGTLTVGSVTSGSTVAFVSTAGNTLAQGNSGDFTIPSNGYYIFAVANSGTTAASSGHDLFFQLQSTWT